MTTEVIDRAPPRAATGSTTWPTPPAWASAFVPFGLGLVVALLAAEVTQDLRLFRTIYTIRVALLITIVALAAFPFRLRSTACLNAWRLTWTFGLLAYLVHFAYGWLGVFGGQVATANQYPTAFGFPKDAHPTTWDLVVLHQTAAVLWGNLVVTGLWAIDALLAWTTGRARGLAGRLVAAFHGLAWLAVLVASGVSTLWFGKNDVSKAIGYVLAAAVGGSLLARLVGLIRARRDGEGASIAPPPPPR